MKLFTAATVLSLATSVLAFEATVPCLFWSPREYIKAVVKPNSQLVVNKGDAVSSIMASLSDTVCSAHMIALVNQPEIHSEDFTRSDFQDAFTHLKEQNRNAEYNTQIQYIKQGVNVQELAQKIATQCNTAISILDASTLTSDDLIQEKKPIVAIVSLPAANNNVNTLKENDNLLGNLIESIEGKVQDNYVVIYTSSQAKSATLTHKLERRAPQVTPKLPIFAKYQLFTPGIFMVLGVVLLFLFILGVGITWLVGIQTPVRMELKQKKN